MKLGAGTTGRSGVPGCRSLLRLVVLLAALLPHAAHSHQELLFAQVTTVPPAPLPGRPFEVEAGVSNAAGEPVVGIQLTLALYEDEAGLAREEPLVAVPLREAGAPGSYRASIPAQIRGSYLLRLTELEGGGEQSTLAAKLEIGSDLPVRLELILPPSGGGLGRWLLWLLGLPLLAGLLITLLVLTGKKRDEQG